MKVYISVVITIISVVVVISGIFLYQVSVTSSPERYFQRGKNNFEIENYQEAINDFNEYIAIENSRMAVLDRPSDNVVEAEFLIADALEKEKKFYLAREQLAKIINDPKYELFTIRAVISYANISRLLNESDNYIVARLEQFLNMPNDPALESQINMLYGYQLFFQKKYGEALSYFLRADGELAVLGRARVYHSMNEYDRAFEVYEDFINYYKSSEYYKEVVRTYLIQAPGYAHKLFVEQNYSKARYYYQKIASLFPNTEAGEDGLFKTAQTYYYQKNYNSAITYYDRVTTNNIPKLDAEALLYKGISYFKLDLYDKSYKVLDSFVVNYPTHANVGYAKEYLASLREISIAIN